MRKKNNFLNYKLQISDWKTNFEIINFLFFVYYFEMNFVCAEEDHSVIVSKKEYVFLKWWFQFKTLWSLNLVLFFDVKSEFKFENIFFTISYLTIVLSCHYLSNELTIEIDVLNFHLKGCLYESRDAISSEIEQ